MICTAMALLVLSGERNLLVNGDFRHGTRGFSSSYGLSTDLLGDGTYAVAKDPKLKHHGACSIQDPKQGNRNMLLVNGSATANLCFWTETVRVQPNHSYEFRISAASWSKDPTNGAPRDPSPGRILLRINGHPVAPGFELKPGAGDWVHFVARWTSGAETEARIRLYDDNTNIIGNDFAVDDLAFVLVPH